MPLRLRPVERGGDPLALPLPAEPRRGLFLHWRTAEAQEVVLGRKSRRRRVVAPPTWECKGFIFRALRGDGDDHPPENDEMQQRMVLRAYALAASHWPIPSDAEVLYEVRT